MSKFLHLLNQLKQYVDKTILTVPQQNAYENILEQWRFPERLNLCGPKGSGKTFLGWVLSRQSEVSFYATPQLFQDDIPLYISKVIIDNTPTEEKALRKLMSVVQLRDIPHVLFITQQSNRLGYSTIQLPYPSEDDLNIVNQNLNRLQFIQCQLPRQNCNFWDIIQSTVSGEIKQ